MKPCPAGHELMPPLPVRSSNPPVLSKAEHKRILLCIELIQSAAAVAEREDHEPDPDPEPEPHEVRSVPRSDKVWTRHNALRMSWLR